MAVFKVRKVKNYTSMSNEHLQNKELSLKAKGLLSYMLSLPDDWNYSLEGLVPNCKESKTSIRSTLNELKQHGYLSVEKLYPNKTESKKIEYDYNIYEERDLNPYIKNQDMDNPYLASQHIENNTQQSTNKQITNRLNTKEQIDKEDKHNKCDTIIMKNHC